MVLYIHTKEKEVIQMFLRTKKMKNGDYQVKGTNVYLKLIDGGWNLRVGDSAYESKWVRTHDTKADAIQWLQDNPKTAQMNGVRRVSVKVTPFNGRIT